MTIADVMRHDAGLAFLSKMFTIDFTTTENIKANKVGEILENETSLWFQEGKTKDPAGFGPERQYHAITRDFISNEIFRRAHPEGKTMA